LLVVDTNFLIDLAQKAERDQKSGMPVLESLLSYERLGQQVEVHVPFEVDGELDYIAHKNRNSSFESKRSAARVLKWLSSTTLPTSSLSCGKSLKKPMVEELAELRRKPESERFGYAQLVSDINTWDECDQMRSQGKESEEFLRFFDNEKDDNVHWQPPSTWMNRRRTLNAEATKRLPDGWRSHRSESKPGQVYYYAIDRTTKKQKGQAKVEFPTQPAPGWG